LPSTVTTLTDNVAGSLRDAINITPSGGTVDFAPGLTGTITLSAGQLTIAKNLTINGPGATGFGMTAITVNGGNASRVFNISSGFTVTISGLAIKGGLASGNSSTPGGASSGGGILNAGTLTLKDDIVSGNTATGTGAGAISFGGGIFNSGTLTITNSTISNDAATAPSGISDAGGIFNNGTLTLTATTVSNNTANSGGSSNGGAGGGILTGMNASASATLTNCTVSSNTANGAGGGILISGGTLTLTNCTIAGNTATGPAPTGGGISNTGATTVNLQNTIVALNGSTSGPDIFGLVASTSTNNLIGNGSGSTGLNDGSNGNLVGPRNGQPINPLLGTLQDNGGPTPTRALLANSPAIDAGLNTGITVATDQRGFKRIVNNTIDIGAYEFQPPDTTTTLNALPPIRMGRSVTLLATVTANAPGSNAINGAVTFLDGASQLGTVNLVNGMASLTTSALTLGRHPITARYNGFTQGDFHFNQSVSPLRVQVVRSGFYSAVGTSNGHVQIRKTSDGSLLFDFMPYGPAYTGGVNVAVGDITGDGFEELVTAAAVGNPHVKVYNGAAIVNGTFSAANADSSLLASFFPYALQFNVGATVAVGDVNGDGFGDLITGANVGNPDVRVYNGTDIARGTFNPNGSSLLVQWFAYGLNFNVGVNVAAGDLNADGFADVVTGATGGNPHVKVYSGLAITNGTFNGMNPDASLLAQLFPFALQFNVGAYVAVGDLNGDGFADLITGSSVGNPEVKTYNGKAIVNGTLNPGSAEANKLDDFFAYNLGMNIGVTVAAGDFENNGTFDILTGSTQGPPVARVFRGTTTGVSPPSVLDEALTGFPPGLFVGA
jgi:hypothetical protein